MSVALVAYRTPPLCVTACRALHDALPQVLGRQAFTQSMLEKLIWICAFMLVGARHGGCTVGEVEAQHREEVNGNKIRNK